MLFLSPFINLGSTRYGAIPPWEREEQSINYKRIGVYFILLCLWWVAISFVSGYCRDFVGFFCYVVTGITLANATISLFQKSTKEEDSE